jgi:hypothetical protein
VSVIGGMDVLKELYEDESKIIDRYFKLLEKAWTYGEKDLDIIESMELSFPVDYSNWLIVIKAFDVKKQEQILHSFVANLKANIEIAEIRDDETPPKDFYNALRIYEIHLNMLSLEKEEATSITETYDTDVNKIKKLFSFLNDDIIACKEHEFLKAVATANFSNITILKKSKFQFMIFALGTYNGGMSKEWYLESAKSINKRASKCSGATVEDDYKKDLGDIIKKEFEVIEKHKKTLTNIG